LYFAILFRDALFDQFLYQKIIYELIFQKLGLDLAAMDGVLTYFFSYKEFGRNIDEVVMVSHLLPQGCPPTERSSHY
jgi:hypothetical protein